MSASAPRTIAITGASGLVGRALSEALAAEGRTVIAMVRDRARADGRTAIHWNPATGEIDADALASAEVDAVVGLAGESIGGGRWTAARKARIRDSRVDGTRLVAETLAGLDRRPSVMVSASAMGFYGDSGDAELDERGPLGIGFLAEVCQAWEAAAEPARAAGIRVVHPRIALVIAHPGGALEKMMTPFKLGLGGRIGSGTQWMSWIGLEDLVRVLVWMLDGSLAGPINACAPNPVTNADFTRALAKVLRRPAFLPAPSFALKAMLGEMAGALLLGGNRLVPRALLDDGFEFHHPELEPALRAVLP